MKYICCECGNRFDEDELVSVHENMGECFGFPAYDDYEVTPCCKSENYEELFFCEICGEYFCEDEMTEGVCDTCLYDEADVETCLKIGDREPEKIEINSFLASMYSRSEIEEILYNDLKKADYVDCKPFIDNDKSWFADNLKEVKE